MRYNHILITEVFLTSLCSPSDLRNRLPSIAHPKYEGVRVSRKQLLGDSDSGHEDEVEGRNKEGSELGDDGDNISSQGSEDEGGQNWEETEQRSEDEGPSESEGEESDGAEEDIPRKPAQQQQPKEREDPSEDLTSTIKKTRENDLMKGQAIKRQIVSVFDYPSYFLINH